MFSLQFVTIISIISAGILVFLLVKLVLKKTEISGAESESGALREDMEFVKTALQTIVEKNEVLDEMSKKINEAEDKNRALTEKISETRNAIDEFSRMQKMYLMTNQSTANAVSQIEKVLIGFKPKDYAISGNIVQDALSVFPKDIIEKEYPVAGSYVEFAIILPNRKILPVESRFERRDLLEKMNTAKDENEKKKIAEEIKNAIIAKIAESVRYTDIILTEGFCVLALPDIVYQMASEFLFDSFRKGVIVISYSNTIPYILTVLKLREKYAPSVDLQKLSTAIESALNLMYDFGLMVETTMSEAVDKVNTAHRESKRYIQELQVAMGKIKTERLDTEIDRSINSG